MAAYFIADIEVTDSEGYEEYRKLAVESIERYGGRFIVRGGPVHVAEGEWQPKRLVILEFESVERVRQWLNSSEYAHARDIRHRTARTLAIIAEGV